MNPRLFLQNLPVQRQLSLLVLVPCATVLLLAGTVLVSFQLSTFRRTFERDLIAVADIMAHNSTAAIAFNDESVATETLNALRAKEHIVGAALVRTDGKLFARYGAIEGPFPPAPPAREPVLTTHRNLELVATPIILDNKTIATLYVASDYRGVYRSFLALIGCFLGLVALLAAFVATMLSSRLQRMVSDPIAHLAATARQVADAADYSVRAREESGAEFGVLTRAFNQMLARIQSQDAALHKASQELSGRVEDLEHEIAERLKAEQKLAELHKELVTASRRAGMAEVASGVLHNVGNVLNSINVSISVISDQLRHSQRYHLDKLAVLLDSHRADLPNFLTVDPKGKLLPNYLVKLCHQLPADQATLLKEVQSLTKNIDHVKQVIATQQSYARMGGLVEDVQPEALVEDALQIHAAALLRQGITLQKRFEPVPAVRVDKHKVLQILVNLFQNARHALDASGRPDKRIDVAISADGTARVRVVVHDNGIGIPAENLTRIFQHGFTTKRDGHGFGLHSGALAAKEMGGTLAAASDGPGTGATFTLQLPAATAPAATFSAPARSHARAA